LESTTGPISTTSARATIEAITSSTTSRVSKCRIWSRLSRRRRRWCFEYVSSRHRRKAKLIVELKVSVGGRVDIIF
jgi:hypothetical protein